MITSLNDYVMKDQVFAWNKHVKLFFGCQCSGKCHQLMCFDFLLLVTRNPYDK